MIFSENDKTYTIYTCSGKGRDYRESGSYSIRSLSYLDAARNYSDHARNISYLYSKYDSNWKILGQKKGYPKKHIFLQNDNGIKLLLIEQSY